MKTVASLGLGAFFVYWFAHRLNWREVWAEVCQANWVFLALALSLFIGTYFVRVIRWRALLEPMANASLRGLFRATVVGFSALFVMGRAGEMIVRPAALSLKERVHPSASYATVMIERVFDMVMVVFFFAVNLIFLQYAATDAESLRTFGWIKGVGVFLLFVALGGIYGLSVFRTHRDGVLTFLEKKFQRLPRTLSRALLSLLRHISEGLAVLHNARELAVTVSYTILLWLMVAVAHLLVVHAFGISYAKIPFTGAVFVMGLSMLGSIVPTPGGATGPFHTATAAALTFLGAVDSPEQAASIAIVLHLVIFAPATLFGLLYIIKDGLSLGRLLQIGERQIEETDNPDSLPPAQKESGEEAVAV